MPAPDDTVIDADGVVALLLIADADTVGGGGGNGVIKNDG